MGGLPTALALSRAAGGGSISNGTEDRGGIGLSDQDAGGDARCLIDHEERKMTNEEVREFISEDDLRTFEGWLRYQAVDQAAVTSDELADWRSVFDEVRENSAATPKVGLMKLKPLVPGEYRYAVAIGEGSDLLLTLWVKRSPKGEFFVMIPRGDRGWDPHASYHLDGTFHSKSFGHKFDLKQQKRQRLTGAFRGTEHLGAYAGHGPKGVGAICDPTAFSGVVEVAPGVLGPRDGAVVVDLVEPGCEPMAWHAAITRQEVFRDMVPWVVIRIVP
jgi:hypothetical protein